MKLPSRRMQPAPKAQAKPLRFALARAAWTLILILTGVEIYRHPGLLFAVFGLVILSWLAALMDRRRWRRLARSRSGEGICTFVRAFDWRQVDTWVLRAVYDEFSHGLTGADFAVPVRADDRLFSGGFGVDALAAEELAAMAAIRAGRRMDDSGKNPYFGKVHTLRDLVHFLDHQPRLAVAE